MKDEEEIIRWVMQDEIVKSNKLVAERACKLILNYWENHLKELRKKLLEKVDWVWDKYSETGKMDGAKLSHIIRVYDDELKKKFGING